MSALTIPADIAPAVAARLWVAVDRASGDGCWLHRTAARSGRRGIIDVAGRDQYAYRVAWVLTNGPIPDGVLVCHHCDNPPCCRPDHLFLGSSKDNAQDAKRKGRLRLPEPRRGEASPAATARDVEVEEARRLYQAGGHTQAELAVRYGVAPSTMGRWMRGVARSDVPVRKPPLPDACGSRAGYCRHQKRRETSCDPCRAANTAYLREYKAARRMRPGAVAAWSRPIILEVCAGEGGSTLGLMRAGWDVIAVDDDANRLARNPARWKIHGDALEVLDRLRRDGFVEVDGERLVPAATWGGWPCQDYSRGTAAIRAQGRETGYKRLIAAGRAAQRAAGVPYVIENVEDAKPEMLSPVLLCGRMFGLSAIDEDGTPLILDRHRLFESDVLLMTPPHPTHTGGVQVAGVYGGARTTIAGAKERGGGYTPPSERVQCDLLGVPVGSMTGLGRRLCIPPVYAEFVGAQLLEHLAVAA